MTRAHRAPRQAGLRRNEWSSTFPYPAVHGDKNQDRPEAMMNLEAGGGDENQDERQMRQPDESLFVFYGEVELLEQEMTSIHKLLVLRQDVMFTAHDCIYRHVLEVVKTSLCIRGRLQDMGRSDAANRDLLSYNKGAAVDWIRTLLTNMLRRNIKELLMDFQSIRQRIMEDFIKVVRHRFYTITAEVPFDEVLEKMFAEEKSEEILSTALYSIEWGKVTETFSEIQDKCHSANNLEDSLLEHQQLLLDDSQGEKITNRDLLSYNKGATIDWIRTLLTNMLRRNIKELLMNFQSIRQRIMEDFIKVVRHCFYTVTVEVPFDEVLEKMFAEGKSEEKLKTALYSIERGKVTKTFSEIQDKCHSAKNLKNSLLKLQQLLLVDSQGEKINDIENVIS